MRQDTEEAQRKGKDDAGAAAHGTEVVSLDRLRRYKVADGEPDIRGWQVLGDGGVKIGQVDDLLVDTTAMTVRYLQVRLDAKLLDGPGGEGAAPESAPWNAANAADTAAQGIPALDSMAASGSASNIDGIAGIAAVPGVVATAPGSFREHLVRETLSDIENQLTADHHLGNYHYAGERHILLPIGQVRLDTPARHVQVDGMDADGALRLPPHEPGTLDRDFAEELSGDR